MSDTKDSVLCVEVGNTRIKACFFPNNNLTFKDLQTAKIFTFPSHPWLKGNMNQLFDKSLTKNPLYDLLLTNPTKISLSIFGPLYDKRVKAHLIAKNGIVFENLYELLQKTISCDLFIESDAVSWAVGALEYFTLQSQVVEFPCLAITFGTYIGIALIENAYKITALEIWALNPSYTRLKPFAQIYNKEAVAPAILAKIHIDELAGGEEHTESFMKTYRPEFNLHVQAFIEDICEYIQHIFPELPSTKTILIGGGFSRSIDPPKNHSRRIYPLNSQLLMAQGISADVIQLLGCYKMSQEDRIETHTHPSLQEIQARFKK